MVRLRRTPVLLFAVAAWCWGLLVGTAHEVAARHAICPEHGEVVEVHGETPGAHAPQFVAAQIHAHQDGCEHPTPPPIALAVPFPVSQPALEAALPEPHGVSRAGFSAAALSFAPKTSPPALG